MRIGSRADEIREYKPKDRLNVLLAEWVWIKRDMEVFNQLLRELRDELQDDVYPDDEPEEPRP